ncbi:MAG: uracil-DNA glycosylase family protein [Proteobacteria bacterium]|nr:uracil-DNA glycosylase family protein [Pseudomonadota bacterium]
MVEPAAGLDALLVRVRACTLCADHLPHGPRPVLRAQASARLLIIGQAPGTRVHETGVPWNDPSGERLRAWMDMGPGVFYDETRVAIMPMAFCYPGRDANGGDLPPRPECAPAWHEALLAHLADIRLTLLVGAYAQARYLGPRAKGTMTETVRAWRDHGPGFLPLPHPSWRNTGWLKRNPWFESDVIPDLRARLARALG